MRLAKPHIDIGVFSCRIEPMLHFYQDNLGLPFDHMLPLGGGVRQYRHDLLGSVLKLNHSRHPLPPANSGYRELVVTRPGATEHVLSDPDGNRIRIVQPGHRGVARIGIRLAVRDPKRHARFLTEALGARPVPDESASAFRLGDSVLLLDAEAASRSQPVFPAQGLCYLTLQVHDVDAAHTAAVKAGGAEGRPPETLGDVARISFILDPDGDWIELSQRASVTGRTVPRPD